MTLPPWQWHCPLLRKALLCSISLCGSSQQFENCLLTKFVMWKMRPVHICTRRWNQCREKGPVQALGSVQVSVPEQVLGRILVLVPEQVLGMVLGGNWRDTDRQAIASLTRSWSQWADAQSQQITTHYWAQWIQIKTNLDWPDISWYIVCQAPFQMRNFHHIRLFKRQMCSLDLQRHPPTHLPTNHHFRQADGRCLNWPLVQPACCGHDLRKWQREQYNTINLKSLMCGNVCYWSIWYHSAICVLSCSAQRLFIDGGNSPAGRCWTLQVWVSDNGFSCA